MVTLDFEAADPDGPDAAPLLEALSRTLRQLTGSTGEASFSAADVQAPRSVFLLGRHNGVAVACGALREIEAFTCEFKRVYSASARSGAGSKILAELERRATVFGYGRIVAETRKINGAAVSFYPKNGYAVIPNFGKYAGNDAAICFGKPIDPGLPPGRAPAGARK